MASKREQSGLSGLVDARQSGPWLAKLFERFILRVIFFLATKKENCRGSGIKGLI